MSCSKFLFITWHDWEFAGEVDVVEPKRGQYDPRSDEKRTITCDAYVCCNCGETENRRQMGSDYY